MSVENLRRFEPGRQPFGHLQQASKATGSLCERLRETENSFTHPPHCTGTVVSVHSRFTGVSHRSHIALPTQENGVYQWLRLIQVLQQEESSGAEAQQNRQVICDDITGQGHVQGSARL